MPTEDCHVHVLPVLPVQAPVTVPCPAHPAPVALAVSIMPLHHVRRKYRYYSEPPPLREGADSSDSGDDLVADGVPSAERSESRKPVAHGLLTAQATRASVHSMNKKVELQQSRSAFDAQLRAIGKRTRGTTSGARMGSSSAIGSASTTTPASDRSVAFPLTPTSAAGEGERSMGSLTGTGQTSACESASDNNDNQPKVKMSSHQSSVIHNSTRPPPSPALPVSSTSQSRSPPSHTLPNGSGPSLSSASTSSSAVPRTMSHRIENPSIRSRHFQDQHFHDNHYYSAHPSPPPITTLTHSPSLSSDRSSVNSPAPTILPPLAHHQFQSQSYSASAAHRYPSAAQPGVYHHSHYYPNTISPPEVFTAPAPSYAHPYGGGYAPPPFHHATDMSMSPSQQYAVNPYATTGTLYGGHGGGGSGGFTPIYTDDASTKLSDRVRRRCFNCCTTDTSTWRRSSLNPGKVLCNKCGLFERTHSRPRPEQFPHKRAPLQMPSQNGAALAAPAQSSAQSHIPAGSNSAPHNLPPTTGHPSLGAGYSNPSALPQIQEWLRPNPGSGSGANNHTGTGSSSASSSAGPSSRAHSASSAADNRHHPYASMSGPGPNSGAGASRSPQGHSARLAKRSNSVNSDFVDTPPQQHRTAQNLTPSPSPPPETAQTSGTAVKEDSSERVPSSHSAGTETSKA